MWDSDGVSAMSRRGFLAATATVLGAGLAAACDSESETQGGTKAPAGIKPILIVGAGMAGLGAARILRDAGWPVQVIEARDRIGGRVLTTREWGVPLDMGASWIHGTTNNPLSEVAKKAGIETFPTDYFGVHATIDPLVQPNEYNGEIEDRWRKFVERAADDADGGTLAAAVDKAADLDDLSDAERLQLAVFVNTDIAQEFAANADQLSATKYDEGDYTTGAQVILPSGYDNLARTLAEGLDIVTNAAVTNVVQGGDSVSVRAGNRSFDGSAAIVTVPLGVLKSGAIAFDPPLPDRHAQAVEALGFGVLSKSYFRFEERKWKDEGDFHQFMGTDPVMWAQWFTLPAQIGPIVLAFNAGKQGRAVESTPPDQLMTAAIPIARRIFGEDLKPVEVKTSNWSLDPYALGSYSFQAPGSSFEDRARLQDPISDRLYLAGEAVGTDNPATAHGALLSGRHAAGELMRRLG
jgi:polyamine oxidase